MTRISSKRTRALVGEKWRDVTTIFFFFPLCHHRTRPMHTIQRKRFLPTFCTRNCEPRKIPPWIDVDATQTGIFTFFDRTPLCFYLLRVCNFSHAAKWFFTVATRNKKKTKTETEKDLKKQSRKRKNMARCIRLKKKAKELKQTQKQKPMSAQIESSFRGVCRIFHFPYFVFWSFFLHSERRWRGWVALAWAERRLFTSCIYIIL